MATQRHWKQIFDPNAKFVYRKRRKFALDPEGFMRPGEIMPEDVQKQVGRHRLKMWWRAGWIELADFEPPRPYSERMAEQLDKTPQEPGDETDTETSADEVVEAPVGTSTGMRHTGGGWYDVTLPDGSTDRVHGKVSAQELLDSFDG